jgi:hypothetical protein
MTKQTKLGGSFTFPNTSVSSYRMGYGAMQLAGPGGLGTSRNVDAAVAVLGEATAAGVNPPGASSLQTRNCSRTVPETYGRRLGASVSGCISNGS